MGALVLPRAWWSAGGNGTYQPTDWQRLPRVSGDPTFAWLRNRPEPLASMKWARPLNDELLLKHAADAERTGLHVPESFVTFVTSSELHTRVPSSTACSWDLGRELLPVPERPGPERLLRFMGDQKSGLLWYLLLEPSGGHKVVVGPLPDLTICADSFEEFVKRFWLENTIWFAVTNGLVLSGELKAYVEAAKAHSPRASS